MATAIQNQRAAHIGPPDLRRALKSWQIVLLAISGIIGVTIFSTLGTVLHTASTAGTLVALGFVGAIAICVMASLGELIVLWPVPNALVEYVKCFVDEDLAKVVGITYWYTWSSVFTTLLLVAYDFLCEFLPRKMYRIGVLLAIGVSLMLINGLGVKTYGWIEAIGGIIKALQAIAGGLFLWIAIGKDHAAPNPAFGYNVDEANNWLTSLCMSIPILAYGLIGVEIVAVTAFEAVDRRSLREPVRWIAWFMTAIYFWVAIPGTILVAWHDRWLTGVEPTANTAHGMGTVSREVEIPSKNETCLQTYPYVELAAFRFGSIPVGRYWNACIIYFCVSSANTALYVASRTLYGLFRPTVTPIQQPQLWWQQCIPRPSQLGMVSPRGVPVAAMVLSASIWTPLIAARVKNLDVLGIMTTVGSVGGVMVWAMECIAFIKYYEWLSTYQSQLPPHYTRDSRELDWQKKRPFFSSGQPYVAWAGLLGCFVIVFVLGSASWWDGDVTLVKVTAAYVGPVAILALFILLKLWRRVTGNRAAAEQYSGLEISRILEDLSMLPLDRAPPEPTDEERRADRSPFQAVGDWFQEHLRLKEPVVMEEPN